LGRLTAAAARSIRAMVLIAPLLTPWHPTCGMITAQMEELWERDGFFPVEESASGELIHVHVEFIRQLKLHSESSRKLECPTLIIHGSKDEVVPVAQSVEFCAWQTMTRLVILEDNHRLLADPNRLLLEIEGFVSKKLYRV
jgi:pimeloyl-ACP methyl ester carboxylesterase